MKPRISIVSAYQSQVEMTKHFLDCLQSNTSDALDVEMILINAGSKDKIEHPFITKRIDLDKNISFAHSMNTGIGEAIGDYIVVIGNDGFPQSKSWLTTLLSYQVKYDADIVCPEPTRPPLSNYKHKIIKAEPTHLYVSMFPAICYFMPRSTIEKIGGFDERFIPTFYEDDDYCRRVLNAGGKIIVVKGCMLEHKVSAENNANFNCAEIMRINGERFKEKWKNL